MFVIEKLAKLKKNKHMVLTSVSVLLILSVILLMAAWSSNAVTVHDGDKTLNLKTKASTVYGVLEEAGISLGDFDKVVPDGDEAVSNNMTISVYRAMKVSVSDEGTVVEYLSAGQNVQEILNQAGYDIGEKDTVVPSADSKLSENMLIEIRRAKNFTVVDENGERNVKSSAYTVDDLLSELQITRGSDIYVSLPSGVKLKEGMKITISKVTVDYVDVTEVIPYVSETRNNSSMAKGTTKVSQAGKNGVRKVTYEVKYKDGVEVERTEVNSVVEKDAVKRIVDVGTKGASSSGKGSAPTFSGNAGSSSAKSFSYSRVITCSASAYDLSYESCGKYPGDPNYGITASGMKAQYGVVAVDPSVIPLGTRLYIESVDGTWTYGYCVAGDTGSGIKGNRVDLFYNSRGEALAFGRRQAKVYILN